MPVSLLPKIITQSLTDITPELLSSRNIRLLMMDFDNTIVPYTTNIPQPLMEQWLVDAAEWDIPVCVVSNSKNDRVQKFCRNYGIPCIIRAKKPGTKGINECLEKYGRKPEECALAGDQIFTDTLGGNRAGVTPILIRAIDNHNIWLKLRHVAELPFIFVSRKRRITK